MTFKYSFKPSVTWHMPNHIVKEVDEGEMCTDTLFGYKTKHVSFAVRKWDTQDRYTSQYFATKHLYRVSLFIPFVVFVGFTFKLPEYKDDQKIV